MDRKFSYHNYFGKDIEVFYMAISVLGIAGCLFDLIFNSTHEKPILLLNIGVISILSILILVYYSFKIPIRFALSISIYCLLANIALSIFFTRNSPDLEMWYFRDSLFGAILLTIASLTLGKKHGYFIGLSYVLFSLFLVMTTKNSNLVTNLPISLIIFISFAFTMSYFVQKLQTTITSLHEKNTIIERQSKSLEESYIQIEEVQTQLEENFSELQSMATTIEENNELLEKQNANLLETNLTKDRFFSIISHDLRGPLSANTSLLELMLKRFDLSNNEKKKEQLNVIIKSTHNLYQLLENLLIWSRSQTHSLSFKPMDINILSIVKKGISMLQSQADLKKIKIEINISEDLFIKADKMMLETIFRNILSNAIKFTKNGGLIKISAQNVNSIVEITISDNGVGMAEEKVQRLFKLTESISSPGTEGERGTGLGLILCKDFIEQNEGTLEVQSTLGEGSTFTLIFPQTGSVT